MRPFFLVLGKELLGFFRSAMLVVAILYSFTLDIYIAGEGIQLKPRNVTVGYVDETGGAISQKILAKLHAPEFAPPRRFLSQKELSRAIFNKEIVVGLIFESDFAKNYYKEKTTRLDVLLDATAASQSLTTLSYLRHIVLDFQTENLPVQIVTHKLFNQNADNHTFMALTELLSIVTMLVIILTAIVFVKEKERGTWDMMLLMPVDPKITTLAKSLSPVLVVTAGTVLAVGFVLFGQFHMPMNGSFWAFILLTFLYAFSASGIGLFVAAVSKNVMQVAQLSIVIMMPLIFLSGAWTPVYAMHPFFQKLSLFSPLRYYIEGSESIFYRGTAITDLLPYFGGVSILGLMLYWFGFYKIGKLF